MARLGPRGGTSEHEPDPVRARRRREGTPRPSAWSRAARAWSSSRPATCCARPSPRAASSASKVKGIMAAGRAGAPTRSSSRLIEDRLPEAEAAGGAIFDGFPRTAGPGPGAGRDAGAAAAARIDRVVRLKVDDEALTERDRRPLRRVAAARTTTPRAFEVRLWTPTTARPRLLLPVLPEPQQAGGSRRHGLDRCRVCRASTQALDGPALVDAPIQSPRSSSGQPDKVRIPRDSAPLTGTRRIPITERFPRKGAKDVGRQPSRIWAGAPFALLLRD